MGKSKEAVQIQDQRTRVDGEPRLAVIEIAACDCSELNSLL